MSALLLAEAKKHLNIAATDVKYDDELQTFIDAAEALLSHRVGPLVPTTVTSRLRATGGAMVLPVAPVASLTSVTKSDASTLTLTDLYLDTDAGLVVYADGLSSFVADIYTVAYTAGWTVVPADLMLATKELVRHLWTTQRGGNTRPGSAPMDPVPGAAYALPSRVEQLISPYVQYGVA